MFRLIKSREEAIEALKQMILAPECYVKTRIPVELQSFATDKQKDFVLVDGRSSVASYICAVSIQISTSIQDLLSEHSILGKKFVYKNADYTSLIEQESRDIQDMLSLFAIPVDLTKFNNIKIPLYNILTNY